MSLRILSASALVFSPLKAASFLLGGIAVAIVITGCQSAEPKENEVGKQESAAAETSLESQKAVVSSIKPESTTTKTVQAPKTAMSPKETYIKMMAEFTSAQTAADIETAFLKYATKEQISKYEAERVLMNNAAGSYFDPSDDVTRENTDRKIAKFKETVQEYKEVTTIQESVNGSTATVSLGSKYGQMVSMYFVLENNQWKLAKESWDEIRH